MNFLFMDAGREKKSVNGFLYGYIYFQKKQP